jgi:mannose-6-phosphate isomerase-like protein (cupin superfamily)
MSKTFKHRWPEAPNLMNRLWLLGPIAILLLSAAAQEAGPAGFEHWAPASLKRFESKMHADASADPHHFAVELLADFPNDSAMLVHRESDGQAEWHETQVDVFFVQSGSATLLIGGTLVNGETVGPHEKRNGTIQGGVRRRLSAGDVVRIPPRVPHQLLLEGAPEFNYFVIKVKGY